MSYAVEFTVLVKQGIWCDCQQYCDVPHHLRLAFLYVLEDGNVV